MQIFEDKRINEKVYVETLENNMKIMVIPKHETQNKYIIWATKFGSIDNHFVDPTTKEEVRVPDGIAHYLEHKMFEQKSGVDSLYTLMGLGLLANAYTTSDHTAYLFGGTENFYPGLDELMDYVQHPYYTDENVEKERGIIGQEINMYDNEPFSKLYINCMKGMYKNNTINIDTAGTVESISHITKETLYSCYNTFYHPSNMVMVIAGDFEPEFIVAEVKKRLLPREPMGEIKRIYDEEPDEINRKYTEAAMDVNMPMFMIGYKDSPDKGNLFKRQIASEIAFNSLLGRCSEAYQDMYDEGLLMSELEMDYEFSRNYAHMIIMGESKNPEKVRDIVVNTLEKSEITSEDFDRCKKKIYGDFTSEFNSVENIGRMFVQDAVKDYNSMDYLKALDEVNIDYVNKIQKELMNETRETLSVVKGK